MREDEGGRAQPGVLRQGRDDECRGKVSFIRFQGEIKYEEGELRKSEAFAALEAENLIFMHRLTS
jgi:hypothetical protein